MTHGLGVGVDRGRGRGKLKNTQGLPLQLPILEQSRTQCAAQHTAYHSRDNSSTNAEAGPSAPMGEEAPASPVHPEDAREGNTAYANEQEDEDTRMGPA